MAARGLCLLIAVSLLAACGDGDGGGDPSVVGVWRYQSGPAFSASQFSEEDLLGEPKYLVLYGDGFVRLVLREETSRSLVCHEGIWSTTFDSLILQFRNPYFIPTFVFLREQDGFTLDLTDAGGNVSTFQREAGLPVEFQCLPLTVLSTFTGLAEAPSDSRSGLAWDGTSLWFTSEDGGTFPIDPATGVLGSPIDFGFTQFQYVHAAQAGDFWIHCACGHGEETQRRSPGGALVDSVDTLTDLGDELNLDAIAYDSVGNVLWLQGFSFLDSVNRFMKVNSDAEPDVLLATSDFDVRLDGLTWDGTHLWGVTRDQAILRIDPVTLKTLATYETPDPDVEWTGIASAPSVSQPGSALFLIGTDRATDLGVLMEVVP